MSKAKRLFKRLAIGFAAIVILLLLGNVLAIWWFSRPVERQLAEIREAGQPVTFADLATEPGPLDEDARLLIESIQAELKAMEDKLIPLIAHEDEGLLDQDGQQLVESVIADHPDVLPTLEQAATAPRYSVVILEGTSGTNFVKHSLESLQRNRSVARILKWRAQQQHAAGDPDAALATTITLFQLCRHFDQEPTIVFYLVAIACRAVAVAEANIILRDPDLSDESRIALEQELARHNFQELLRHALVTERVLGIAMFEEYSAQLGGWISRPYWLYHMLNYLDYLGQEIEIATLPLDETREARQSIDKQELDTFTRLMAPAVDQLHEATARAAARLRALRILNAILLHAPEAATIDRDQLGLPADVFLDPYNGQPLVIKKTEDGWLIYSVGADREDDGGQIDEYGDMGFRDVGIGPLDGSKPSGGE